MFGFDQGLRLIEQVFLLIFPRVAPTNCLPFAKVTQHD